MYDVNVVADFFLSKDKMTPKKLQKLTYYAYAWTLALMNESADDLRFRLFNSRIEAWIHGPVIPELYHKYKNFDGYDIQKIARFDSSVFSTDVLDMLEQVWVVYGEFTGNQLGSITHQEMPWIAARKGLSPAEASSEQILDRDMFVYYNEQASKANHDIQ